MQSSFNVIKNDSVLKQGSKVIKTEIKAIEYEDMREDEKANIDSYESLAKSIIVNAKNQSEKILYTAYKESEIVLENATSEGHKEGYEKGYSEGNQKGYDEIVGSATKEAKVLIDNAEFILQSAKKECQNYIEEKENEIKEFIVMAVENILKQSVQSSDALNNMIFKAIAGSKNVKLFIIRANPIYSEELKEQTKEWKNQLGYRDDIIVIEDDLMEPGNVIIEKDNGKIMVGIDKGLEKLKEILQGKE